jgi:hypothetical protein
MVNPVAVGNGLPEGATPGSRASADGMRVERVRRGPRDLREGKTPKGRTLRAPPARNRAGRCREEEAVTRVRNPAGGTYRVRQTREEWTPDTSSAERGETSRERRLPFAVAGVGTARL